MLRETALSQKVVTQARQQHLNIREGLLDQQLALIN
jgi:hypothetical protein